MRVAATTASELILELTRILGPKGLLTDPGDIAPFVTDFRGRRTGDALAVALPSTPAEAASAVQAATTRSIPVFAQGGNTGLCYGAVPHKGLVIAMRRMNALRKADPQSGILTVDAGMTLAEVHTHADRLGLQFPLYLGSEGSAQIGGLISTNAGGTGVLRYGTTRDLIAGIEMVLADGRILHDLGGLRKNNTGYPLHLLVCGAEGTLGLVTGAALRLQPKMRVHAHAWLAHENARTAAEAGMRLRTEFGGNIEALEMIDRNQASYVMRHIPGVRMPFGSIPPFSLLVQLASPRVRDELIPDLEEVLAALMADGSILDAIVAQNDKQANDIWHFRHSVTEANKLNGVGVVLDTSVRPSVIPDFIQAADAVIAERFPGAERAIVAHMADGNVHYIVMFPFDTWLQFPDKEAKETEVEQAVHDVVVAHGGSFSAEHGIGRKLISEMERLTDPVRLDLMRRVKAAFDPGNMMNPGILLPGQSVFR